MKFYLRVLLILLVALLSLSAFVGCDEEVIDDPDYDFGNEDDGESFFPDVEKNDYGLDFTYIASSGLYNYIDEDDNSGSPIDEAVYNRQDRVERYLGVDILQHAVTTTTDTFLWRDIGLYIQSAVQNMDGTIDMAFTGSYNGSCVSNGVIQDFSTIEWIDLEADYWNKEAMEELEVNGNWYLGLSDYCLIKTYCISYNKDMLALYESSLEKSIYDTVKDYEWTFDKMIEIASLVYTDKTGDGKTEDDVYGLRGRCWHPFMGFMPSADIPTMIQDESGSYIVAINQAKYFEKTDDLVEKLRNFRDSNAAFFHYAQPNDSREVVRGMCLMFLSHTPSLESYLDYNAEFGVLPYPMYDLDQGRTVGYQSLNDSGSLAIPSYVKNLQMTSEVLEMLAFYSANVKITYYEKLLGKQVADMPDDVAMLDLIWNGVTNDIGFAFIDALGLDTSGLSYMIAQLVLPESTQNVSSYISAKAPTVNAAFRKFISGARK